MAEIMRVEKKLNYLWFSFPEIIDLEYHAVIEEKIKDYLSSGQERIVLDFSKTATLYSSGLGLLIRIRRLVHEAGGHMYLVNVKPEIIQLLSTLNLDKVFNIFRTDVEFELSQNDILEGSFAAETNLEFLFTSQVENQVCRIILGGRMIAGRDYSDCITFSPVTDISEYVFDLGGLELIDSSGIDVLCTIAAKIKQAGGENRIFGASELIRDLIEVFDVDDLFVFFDSEKDALD